MRAVGQIVIFLTLAAVSPAFAQQSVRGQLPDDLFIIDTGRVAKWDSMAASTTAAREFSTRQVEALSLERWQHEFPTQHSSVGEDELEMDQADAAPWKGAGLRQVEPSGVDEGGDAGNYKSSVFGSLIANDKWAKRAGAAPEKVSDEVDTDRGSAFIAQVGIRPLGEQELQEKLNQYSSPPESRTKSSPLLHRTSSKH